MFTRPKGVA